MALVRARVDGPAGTDGRPGHEALQRAVDALEGRLCARCARPLCGHEALIAVTAGLAPAPRCAPCLATALGANAEALLARVRAQVAHRACQRAAWNRATAREPECPLGRGG